MTDESAESPRPRSLAPFVTIRAGGSFDGVVTISAIADANSRAVVAAAWTRDGQQRSVSTNIDGPQAHVLANAWANQLAADQDPSA